MWALLQIQRETCMNSKSEIPSSIRGQFGLSSPKQPRQISHNHNVVPRWWMHNNLSSPVREKHLFFCHFVQWMQDSSHCYMERVFMSSLTSLKSIAKRNQTNKLHSLILMQWVLLCLWSHVFFVAEHVSFIDEDEVTKSKCWYHTYESQIFFELICIYFDSWYAANHTRLFWYSIYYQLFTLAPILQ